MTEGAENEAAPDRVVAGVGGRPRELLVEEKELTRARDALAAKRRRMRNSPRGRGHGQHLELSRQHRAGPAGGVGGVAGRLPPDRAEPVVDYHDEYGRGAA
jgi:Bacterial protein of unknown function (DUF899)